MAEAKQCDICKVFYDLIDEPDFSRFDPISQVKYPEAIRRIFFGIGGDGIRAGYDICPNCVAWLGERIKHERATNSGPNEQGGNNNGGN